MTSNSSRTGDTCYDLQTRVAWVVENPANREERQNLEKKPECIQEFGMFRKKNLIRQFFKTGLGIFCRQN